jgi:hypothetical protein
MKRENLPGIEFAELNGAPGDNESIAISNSLINGLRIEIFNYDLGTACFHIADMQTAMQIAQVLVEYSQRIASPPEPAT